MEISIKRSIPENGKIINYKAEPVGIGHISVKQKNTCIKSTNIQHFRVLTDIGSFSPGTFYLEAYLEKGKK